MQRLRIQTDKVVSIEMHPTVASKIDCGADWIGTGAASWSFWMKMVRKNGSSNIRVFDNGSANISIAGVWSTAPLNSSRIVFASDGRADSSTMPCSDYVPNITNWFNCTITRDASGVANFYINGVLSGTANQATGTPVAATNNVIIGNNAAASRTASAVLFSDLMTFNRVLSAAEVQNIARKNILPADSATSLTARFPLNDGGTPTTIADISGNGHDGTPTSVIARADVPTVKRKTVGGNRIINGNFEVLPPVKNNVPTTAGGVWIDGTVAGRADTNMNNGGYGWYFNKSGTGAALFDPTIAHNGKASLKLSTLAVASWVEARSMIISLNNLQQLQGQVLKVSPNTTYTIEYWMKTNYVSGDAALGATCSVWEYDSTAALTASNSGTIIKTTTEWTKYSYSFTTNANTCTLMIVPRVYGHTGTATLIMDAWFDDIVLTEPTTPSRQSLAKTRRKVRDFGTALQFGATSAKMTTINDVMTNFDTVSYTFAAWVKASLNTSALAADQQAIFGSGTTAPYWYVALRTGNYLLRYQDSGEDRLVSSPQKPNVFTHIAVIADKTNMNIRLYVNGTLVGTQVVTSFETPLLSQKLSIGFLAGGVSLNGIVDEPRLWNRVLTSNEISDLCFKNSVPLTGLIGEWLFNEGSGTTAKDSSGSGNNGTISGAIYTSDVPTKPRTIIS